MSIQRDYHARGVQSPPILSIPAPSAPRTWRQPADRGVIEYAGVEGQYILWRYWEDDRRLTEGVKPWDYRTRAAHSASGAILVEHYVHGKRWGWQWIRRGRDGQLIRSGWPASKEYRIARAHEQLLAGEVAPCARCGKLLDAADPDGLAVSDELWCDDCARCPDCRALCTPDYCECDPESECPACRQAPAARLLAA